MNWTSMNKVTKTTKVTKSPAFFGRSAGQDGQGLRLIVQPLDEALVEREPVRQLMTAKFPYLRQDQLQIISNRLNKEYPQIETNS